MKTCIAVPLLLLMSTTVYAQQPSNSVYPLTVHVFSSEVGANCATVAPPFNCGVLSVTIDGKRYRLEGSRASANVLRTGNYQARIVKDEAVGPAGYVRQYELLFANGKTATYQVVAEFE